MTSILWFRRDLRLTDNPALIAAAAAGPVLPVFVVDEVLRAEGAATRWRLEQSLRAFDAGLKRRGAALTIIAGGAAEIARLARKAGAAVVHANAWPEPARERVDHAVAEALSAHGVRLVLHDGHTLLPPGTVRTANGGGFKVFTPFARALRRHGVPEPAPAPSRIDWAPAAVKAAIDDLDLAPDMDRGAGILARFAPAAGEAAALHRLHAFKDRAAGYVEGRERPDQPDATSGLSDALATGELSPRSVWAAAEAMANEPGIGGAAEKFRDELIWRDFAWSLLADFPRMPVQAWRPEMQAFPFRRDEGDLRAWQRAMTGEPLVDAGLRELYVTGRMHNRVRMIAASYLTKHLLLDWRQGLDWFADTLIDWDPASNAMNWQWVAGSGPDAAPFFRIFNPAVQAERFDPAGEYCRRWLYGWQGSRTAEGRAFFNAVPRSWGLDPEAPYPAAPVVDLAEGRRRALAALDSLRSD